MTTEILPTIFTVEDAADYFRIGKDVVVQELEQGRLHGFRIGGQWRLTRTSLAEFVNRDDGLPSTDQVTGLTTQYQVTDFTDIGPFEYQWPASKEHFQSGCETTRVINGRARTFRIGFTDREAAGAMRRRIVVWLDNWPIVEFAGGNNYESDGLLAGVIKTQDGKQLRPTSKVPEEYKGFRIARYASIVMGPYASKNMAVIVQKDDLESMIRHAIIRGTWKELI